MNASMLARAGSLLLLVVLAAGVARTASAQHGPAEELGSCPMGCPMMGGGMMVVSLALVLALIGALVALAVFLVRRSKGPPA